MQSKPNTSSVLATPGEATPPPRLSLPPVTTSSGFSFPTLYSFPPFFTYVPPSLPELGGANPTHSKQPNEQTWAHQSAQWANLNLAYCRFHRIFRIDLTEEQCESELFKNKAIDRALTLAVLAGGGS